MCTQKPPHDFSQQLYERYREAFNAYIISDVLPALREKQGEYMLKELVKRWDNHKIMVRWLSRFFNYLDRYYIQRHNLAQLKDVGMLCFRDLVYSELKKNVKDAVLALVEGARRLCTSLPLVRGQPCLRPRMARSSCSLAHRATHQGRM